MLIQFTVKNWRSFRDATRLNLVASSDEDHSARVPYVENYDFRILPTAAIYGGNASGKSNLVKALSFAKWLITRGSPIKTGIPVDPFRPDDSVNELSSFEFKILVKNDTGESCVYSYEFSLNKSEILHEKLTLINVGEKILLFDRVKHETPVFGELLKADISLCSVLGSTRDNQLFVTNAISQNTSKFTTNYLLSVYGWFDRLTIITPDTSVTTRFIFHDQQKKWMSDVLSRFDTGISDLDFIDDDVTGYPITQDIAEKLAQDNIVSLRAGGSRLVLVKRQDGGAELKRLVSVHNGSTKTQFDIRDESDGTIRLLDLLPCFLESSRHDDSQNVFVIDEVDRSLHTLLTRQLLDSYLTSCSPSSRSQIIFTTHDVMLMDKDLLRIDEMWVTDRKNDSSTELIALGAYKGIREDESIRTSYLRGHLGGIPRILIDGAFSDDGI